jgi:D-arginine dehydrogenase
VVRALNLAGAAFYGNPPADFAAVPLLSPRGALYVAGEEDRALLAAELEWARGLCPEVRAVTTAEALAMVPALRPEAALAAYLDPTAADMDVAAILDACLRLLRQRGGQVETGAEVLGLAADGEGWRVTTPRGDRQAAVVVNAAGAWADTLAGMAGLAPLGIEPRRRTAIIVDPSPHDARRWPAVADVAERWYVKPEAGKLMASPADATPAPPTDVQPEELDVAICVERIEGALDLRVRRVEHRWAGLRSFAPDATPVVGFDPRARGFFWLAGQGGYGIMTAPVLAALSAKLIAGVPRPVWAEGIDPLALAPARLLQPQPLP